jgi:hypothetical protein
LTQDLELFQALAHRQDVITYWRVWAKALSLSARGKVAGGGGAMETAFSPRMGQVGRRSGEERIRNRGRRGGCDSELQQ